ncbi:MAG: hypothetical protein WC785_04775 [Tatlockia sp.]|jgi:hypothetical protein
MDDEDDFLASQHQQEEVQPDLKEDKSNLAKRKYSLFSLREKKAVPAKKIKIKRYAYVNLITPSDMNDALVPEGEFPVKVDGRLIINEQEVISVKEWYKLNEVKYYFADTLQPVPQNKVCHKVINRVDGRKVIKLGAFQKRVYKFVDTQEVLSFEQKKRILFDENTRKYSLEGRAVIYAGTKQRVPKKTPVSTLTRPGITLTITYPSVSKDKMQTINRYLDQIENVLNTLVIAEEVTEEITEEATEGVTVDFLEKIVFAPVSYPSPDENSQNPIEEITQYPQSSEEEACFANSPTFQSF